MCRVRAANSIEVDLTTRHVMFYSCAFSKGNAQLPLYPFGICRGRLRDHLRKVLVLYLLLTWPTSSVVDY